jgi:DNA polymerase III subunit delta
MTIINSSAADGFIQRLPKDLRFYLVHGSDEGLTHERSKTIVGKLLGGDMDPLRVVRLDGDTIARNPGVLADEAYAIAMFGGERAIWIDAQGRDLLPALAPLFASPPSDCAIVVKAAQLKRGAPLRSAFEKAANAASVECYSDEAKALGQMIDAEVAEAGLAIAPDARAALLELLGADRQSTRGEIAKLILYAHGRSRIEIEDIEAIVSNAAPSSLDDLVDQALLGDLRGAAASAMRYFSDGGDGDQLIVRLIQRLTLLHRLRLEMDQGRSFDTACQASYVRLPAPAARKLAVQAERWTTESIARRLPTARAVSARVRAEPRLGEILATRSIWALAARSGVGKS